MKGDNNYTRSVTILGLDRAESVTYKGRDYSAAEGKVLKKAQIKNKDYIDIEVDNVRITLNRVGK